MIQGRLTSSTQHFGVNIGSHVDTYVSAGVSATSYLKHSKYSFARPTRKPATSGRAFH